jgi:hypothetical protein
MGYRRLMENYTSIPVLRDLFLEESWVLGIEAHPGSLTFALDLVLTEEHSLYHLPLPGEQFCYRKGVLEFREVTQLAWANQGAPPARDASGQLDFENIDGMVSSGNVYRLEGSWGEIEVVAHALTVTFEPDPPLVV